MCFLIVNLNIRMQMHANTLYIIKINLNDCFILKTTILKFFIEKILKPEAFIY